MNATTVATRVVEMGPHHRVWQRVGASTNGQGGLFWRTNSYTELATGMNVRQPDGSFIEASDEIELTPTGAAANRTQFRLAFPADISEDVIQLLLPDGKPLRFRPLGVAYFSADTGESVFVGLLKSSVGVRSDRNRVTYPDCLRGDIRADLVCTVTKAGFESDLVIRAQPLAWPADYGLTNGPGIRLQLLTEFFDPPEPVKERQWLDSREGLLDESLDWGTMRLTRGKAFPSADPDSDDAVTVAKQWIEVKQRRFLVEEIPLHRAQEQLMSLPRRTAALEPRDYDPVLRRVSTDRLLPRTAMAGTTTNAVIIASSTPNEPGFVLDWLLALTSGANKTLQGDSTYFCSGVVNLTGTTTIEGGTCVKFASGTTPKINLLGPVVCKTGPYRPGIFTAKDDDSVGDIVADSSGTPEGKYGNGLTLSVSGSALKHLRFCHANSALRLGFSAGQIDLAHLQFVHCLYGVDFDSNSENTVNVDNSLFHSITNVTKSGYDNYLRGRHLTVDHCLKLFAIGSGNHNGEVHLTNSILADVILRGNADVYDGSNNGFYNYYNNTTFGSAPIVSPVSPFQIVGAGGHYLTDASGFRAHGTTVIAGTLLDSLKTKTTHPPIEFPRFMEVTGELTLFPQIPRYVNDNPDLGYHYDVLDYTMAAMALNGGTVTVQPGTAIGFRQEFAPEAWWWPSWFTEVGINLLRGSTLVCHGTPNRRITFTDVQLVQEAAGLPVEYLFLGDSMTAPDITDNAPPVVDFRFSNFHTSSDKHQFMSGDPVTWTPSINMTSRDCNFFGGWYWLGGESLFSFPMPQCKLLWANNLFERVKVYVDPHFGDFGFEARNNLFRCGGLGLGPISGATAGNWILTDNLFEKVEFLLYTTEDFDHDYNGCWPLLDSELQWGGTTRLGGTTAENDKELTAAPPYQVGPLGSYYLPSTTTLWNTGSRTAADAGLSQYTTSIDQSKEASEGTDNLVNIGLHYVATAGSTSTQPKDSETPTGDGIPDYVEDANGNNEHYDVLAGLETDPALALTDGTIPDATRTIYDDIDLDGDGLTGFAERMLGCSPVNPDNPLKLVEIPENEPYVKSYLVTANYPVVMDGISQLHFAIDGGVSAISGVLRLTANTFRVDWNTLSSAPGVHSLQLYLPSPPGAAPLGAGTRPRVYGQNLCVENDAPLWYDHTSQLFGTKMRFAGRTEPNLNYTIKIWTANDVLVKTINNGTTDSAGNFEEYWNLISEGGSEPMTDDSFKAAIILNPSSQNFIDFPVFLPDFMRSKSVNAHGSGTFTLAFGWHDWSGLTKRRNMIQHGVTDIIFNPALDNEYLSTPLNSWNGDTFYMYADLPSGSDKETLLNDMLNAQNFFFFGHGNGSMFGSLKGEEPNNTAFIDSTTLQNHLNNVFHGAKGWTTPQEHAYRFVIINACRSFDDRMALAFGIQNQENANLAFFQKDGRSAQAFVGWKVDFKVPESGVVECFDEYGVSLATLFATWMQDLPLRTCLKMAAEVDNGWWTCPNINKKYGIFGWPDLTRSGDNEIQ